MVLDPIPDQSFGLFFFNCEQAPDALTALQELNFLEVPSDTNPSDLSAQDFEPVSGSPDRAAHSSSSSFNTAHDRMAYDPSAAFRRRGEGHHVPLCSRAQVEFSRCTCAVPRGLREVGA